MTAKVALPDRLPRAADAPTALDGLLVVDFTRVVAGPACTQTLAAGANLQTALSNADPGQVICLDAGNWGDVTLTRVAPDGSMVVNSSQGGGAKDTWIVG